MSASIHRTARIYTRTGDQGSTSLFNGERRRKDSDTFEALGDVDELNALLGVCLEFCSDTHNGLSDYLKEIQLVLLDMGANLATPKQSSPANILERVSFNRNEPVPTVERWIDTLNEKLPPLRNFILPSGGKCSSHLHLARTVCRRAERHVVSVVEREEADAQCCVYLNRLSDFLFVSARYAAQCDGKTETIYRPRS